MGRLSEFALVTSLILARANQKPLKARCHGATNIGFDVVTNHYDLRTITSHAIGRKIEEIGGRFAEQNCLSFARIFERGNEGTSIQAKSPVPVFEDPVFGESQEGRAGRKLAVSLIETIVGEERPSVANNNAWQSSEVMIIEILFEIRMDQ
jgi:hypothetical protein